MRTLSIIKRIGIIAKCQSIETTTDFTAAKCLRIREFLTRVSTKTAEWRAELRVDTAKKCEPTLSNTRYDKTGEEWSLGATLLSAIGHVHRFF